MASTTPQAASSQTQANDLIVTILYRIEGILNRASYHYISQDSSVHCGQDPTGHEIKQHKEESKGKIPDLESVLRSGIADGEWLAMRDLKRIIENTTKDEYDLGNKKMFDKLTKDIMGIYERVGFEPSKT